MLKCSASQRENPQSNKKCCDLCKAFLYMFNKKGRRIKNLNHKMKKKIEILSDSCDPMEIMQSDNIIKD